MILIFLFLQVAAHNADVYNPGRGSAQKRKVSKVFLDFIYIHVYKNKMESVVYEM